MTPDELQKSATAAVDAWSALMDTGRDEHTMHDAAWNEAICNLAKAVGKPIFKDDRPGSQPKPVGQPCPFCLNTTCTCGVRFDHYSTT